ncbi:hypothetical protein CAPTEDRAFT_102702 [Capitella teleta]|uniref:CDP-diacylglycerol--inositol 3-phosphatidyltransferase n=1 Tax=Capitella teleta TaxID=283909 RepID=R7T7X5_CAPTE|nr:hypothetical protein CAPTEDRAFT_102702 [Capitella teleta]|eukprot:ELT89548.1 hypothetical protein CAPTEDRAFT_102702 [Capitella teleta]
MAQKPSEDNVYLFVPNLIGYARIILAFISFYYMPTNHIIATWCYIISGALDAVDGYAARALGQSSKFGYFLDMLTDRCATMCLLVVLSLFYPQYTILFQLSMTIDIASHWIHTQSAIMKGSDSHKKIDLSTNPVLKHYYGNRIVLFMMCAGNELFYSMLYLLHFTTGPVFPLGPLSFGFFSFVCVVTAPVAIVKTLISLVQLYAACQNVVSIDVEDRLKMKQ